MSLFSTMDISGSGLTAQRKRMDVITQNISNINTTRTAEGGPYRRRVTVLQEAEPTPYSSFASVFENAKKGTVDRGVIVSQIIEDESDFQMEYDPTHPDAGEDGYVRLPNVDQVKEMVDMIAATRAYEANVTAINATKAMGVKALEIGQ